LESIRSRFWEFHCQSGEQKTNRRKFNRFDRKLYNEIEKNSIQIPKSFKGFEIGNMDEANYDLDLHKT
jgi:hypothetical protein